MSGHKLERFNAFREDSKIFSQLELNNLTELLQTDESLDNIVEIHDDNNDGQSAINNAPEPVESQIYKKSSFVVLSLLPVHL